MTEDTVDQGVKEQVVGSEREPTTAAVHSLSLLHMSVARYTYVHTLKLMHM